MRSSTMALWALALLLGPGAASAAWPPPKDATATQLADPANWPGDPGYAGQHWLWGFTPPEATLLPERERTAGVGMGVDAAFAFTTGRASTRLALLSDGVRWEDPDVVARWALQRGECPVPENPDGSTAPGSDPWDRNGDGRFDVRDFTDAGPGVIPTVDRVVDPRLATRADRGDVNGNGLLDPQDLLRLFSNGIDEDGDGLVDDLAGWDFVDGDNDPEASDVSSLGPRAARVAGAEADNGVGGAGVCPDCALLPFRVSTGSEPAPADVLGRALGAAASAKATVAAIVAPLQFHSSALDRGLADCAEANTLVIAPTARDPFADPLPESTALLRVVGVGPDAGSLASATTVLALDSSWSPADVAVSRSGDALSEIATAAGIAGLVASAAPSELSASQLAMLLRAHTLPLSPDSAVDARSGAGRLSALASVRAAASGDTPPTVEWTDPVEAQVLSTEAALPVRGAVQGAGSVRLFAAPGAAPADARFVELPVTAAGGSFEATFDPAIFRPTSGPGELPPELTLRLELRWEGADGPEVAVFQRLVHLRVHPRSAPGYPVRVPGTPVGSPRFVDLDLDGNDELVAATREGQLFAFMADGTQAKGFPVTLGTEDAPVTLVGPPAFGDLDGNGAPELVVTTLEGEVIAVRSTGELSFRRNLGGSYVAPPVVTGSSVYVVPRSGALNVLSADGSALVVDHFQLPLARVEVPPAVTDVDRDGSPDVAVAGVGADGLARAALVRVGPRLTSMAPGWPVQLSTSSESAQQPSAPVIADFDNDGTRELAFATPGEGLRVLRIDGSEAVALEQTTGASGTGASLAVADFDGDHRLALIGSSGTSAGAWTVGHQLRHNRNLAPGPAVQRKGFPAGELAPRAGFALADFDADGHPELLGTTPSGLMALGADGFALEGYPALATPLRGAPAVGVQQDRLVCAAISADGWLYAWTGAGQPSAIQWDGYQHDPGLTGAYDTALPARSVHGIGIPGAPPPAQQGCCTGAPGPLELAGMLAALAALGARRRMR